MKRLLLGSGTQGMYERAIDFTVPSEPEYDAEISPPEDCEKSELVAKLFNLLQNDLRAPYIFDRFESHEDRRSWRGNLEKDELGAKLLEGYRFNALNNNTWTTSFLNMGLLLKVSEADDELWSKFRQLQGCCGMLSSREMLDPMARFFVARYLKQEFHELLFGVQGMYEGRTINNAA